MIKLKEQQIKTLKPKNNNVLVKPAHDTSFARGIILATEFQDMFHATRIWEVIAVPERLVFDLNTVSRSKREYTGFDFSKGQKTFKDSSYKIYSNAFSMSHLTDMELKVGDIVWADYIVGMHNDESVNTKQAIYDIDNRKHYALLQYENFILGKRNNELIPLNGRVIVKKIKIQKKGLEIFDGEEKKKVEVVFAGTPIRDWRSNHLDVNPTRYSGSVVKAGDIVQLDTAILHKLEYDLHNELDNELHYVDNHNIIAINQ